MGMLTRCRFIAPASSSSSSSPTRFLIVKNRSADGERERIPIFISWWEKTCISMLFCLGGFTHSHYLNIGGWNVSRRCAFQETQQVAVGQQVSGPSRLSLSLPHIISIPTVYTYPHFFYCPYSSSWSYTTRVHTVFVLTSQTPQHLRAK